MITLTTTTRIEMDTNVSVFNRAVDTITSDTISAGNEPESVCGVFGGKVE